MLWDLSLRAAEVLNTHPLFIIEELHNQQFGDEFMKIPEKKLNGHKIMVEVKISVHTWKHLKYIKNTTPDCRTYDDAIDTLLNKADMDWDCTDKDDFKEVVGD